MQKNNLNNYNKQNTDDIPLTDIDYAGVIYESTSNNSFNKSSNTLEKSKTKPYSPKKIKKAQNFNYSYFLTGAISLGVIVCSVVLFLTYNSVSDYFAFPNNDNISQNSDIDNNNLKPDETIPLNENTNKNIIGIIKNITSESNIVQLFDPISNKNYALKVIGSTDLRDSFNSPLSIVEFSKGDIVDFSFDSTNKATYIKKSSEAFSLENISNYSIDITNNILKLNEKTYSLGDNLLIYKDFLELTLEDINPLDTLDIKGFNNTIYYIEIKKGHGTIKFVNKPSLPDATLEVNRDIFKPLAESDILNLKEGTHKIVIRSNNITPFVKEVKVISGQETIVDLSEVQNKRGTLLIKSSISDYNLYINNVLETSREPISLSYGAYSIRAEKEGYTPFETQVSINKPQTTIQVNLEKIEQLGKLNITSNPTEAQVFIDNVFVGYTPLEYKVAYGTHNIILKKNGYLDFNLSNITVGKDDSVFNITMHQDTNSNSTSNTTSTETTTQSEPVITE